MTVQNITLASGLVILTFLLNWNNFAAPFERDEGEYAYGAQLLLSGDVPYRDSFLQKPPMIIYTYAIGQLIHPTAVWPPRAIALLFSLGTIILVGYIAYKEWGGFSGWVSMFIYTAISMFPVLTPFAANSEKFMILPLMFAVALFVRFRKQPVPTLVWVFAGVSTACAVLYKPIALPVIGFLLALWFIEMYRENKEWRKLIQPFAILTVSGLMVTVLIMLPIIVRGGFASFWEQVIVFNSAYAISSGFGISNALIYVGKFGYYWFLTLPIMWYFIARPKNWLQYVLLLTVGSLTIYTTPIGHYYLLIMPFIALIVSGGLHSFANEFVVERRLPILFGTVAITLFLIIIPFRAQWSLSPQELVNWVYGTVNPFGEAKEVAEHVAEITKSEDKIFVAGSEPQIYFYANRKSVSPFIITYPLNLPTKYREQFQKEAVEDLTNNPPTLIVVSNRPMSGLWDDKSPTIFIDYLTNLLSEKYHMVGGYVWDQYGGFWEDELTDLQIKDSSYVVYMRSSDGE